LLRRQGARGAGAIGRLRAAATAARAGWRWERLVAWPSVLGRGGDVRVVCDALCMYELELRLIADVGLVSIAAQYAAACARCNAMR